MTEQALCDPEAERSVIGAVLLAPSALRGVLAAGLRPEHFYREAHRQVFATMEHMEGRGQAVDRQTVRFELERVAAGGRHDALLDDALLGVERVGNVRAYAEQVIELAEWRDRERILGSLGQAVKARDSQAWVFAQAELERVLRSRRTSTFSPERWADEVYEFLSETDPPRAVPMPLPKLTDHMGGGLRPGEVMVVGGWTSHGKSIFADSILDVAADRGFRCHAYLTEMSALTRGLRYLTRRTGVPFKRLRERRLDEAQTKTVMDELGKLPYGITVASDWSVDEVVADALHARWDLVVVDMLHGFPYEDERQLAYLSQAMQRLALASTTIDGFAGTAVVAVVHLNETQMGKSPRRPRPGMQSIKGSSSIKQDADFVTFVWQKDDEDGLPTGEGAIWFAKARSGNVGSVDVVLNPRRFRFEMADAQEAMGV